MSQLNEVEKFATRTRRHRHYLWMPILIIIACIMAIVCALYGFSNMISFFKTPTQLVYSDYISGQELRLGGYVQQHSFNPKQGRFILTDNKKDVTVFYKGALPALFREGQGVIVQGCFVRSVDNRFVFQARNVLAKHDESYRVVR